MRTPYKRARNGEGMSQSTRQAMYRMREREKRVQEKTALQLAEHLQMVLMTCPEHAHGIPLCLITSDAVVTLRNLKDWFAGDVLALVARGYQVNSLRGSDSRYECMMKEL